MSLKTSLTGSYPPIEAEKPYRQLPKHQQDDLVRKSIERAIKDQIELGIDVLVDGQVRDDIVSIFCAHVPGFSGVSIPYTVTGKIKPSDEPITVTDYVFAKQLAGDLPVKAHITGPLTIARGCVVNPDSGYSGKTDSRLVRDIAFALGQEARFLVDAGAEIIQIDEPVLADGVDLELAFNLMLQIIESGKIPFPTLHACGNVSRILDDVLVKAPIKVISLEGSWLLREELVHVDQNYLRKAGKQIGLGVISVSNYQIEKLRSVQGFVDRVITRLGQDNIWALMPNCGLRLMPYDKARAKLEVMAQTARSF